MSESINYKIKKRIEDADPGTIFTTSDFVDLASNITVRKCLGRITEEKTITRIIDGIYEKPIYSNLLQEYIPVDPDKVAYAIARAFHWTIAPCGDVVLNKLGLSTQVPVVWSYISDGPYRKYMWDNITIIFKHRANRQISNMSDSTRMVIEAIKTLGKERVDENVIKVIKSKFSESDKNKMLEESIGVSQWIYDVIRKVCES